MRRLGGIPAPLTGAATVAVTPRKKLAKNVRTGDFPVQSGLPGFRVAALWTWPQRLLWTTCSAARMTRTSASPR
jgi:hypothetical protein